MSDPHARLGRQLLALAGDGAALVESASRPWMALTYSGLRHSYALRLDAGAAARLAALLPEHEFALGRHCVADVATGAYANGVLVVAALTIAED